MTTSKNSLAGEKHWACDGITAEVVKCAILQHLFLLLYMCCRAGFVPQDMRTASIGHPVQKTKGDIMDCNYCGSASPVN